MSQIMFIMFQLEWRELMQVPCKCASLGVCIKRYHWCLVLHTFRAIFHLFRYKMNSFIISYIICEVSRSKKGQFFFGEWSKKNETLKLQNWKPNFLQFSTCSTTVQNCSSFGAEIKKLSASQKRDKFSGRAGPWP